MPSGRVPVSQSKWKSDILMESLPPKRSKKIIYWILSFIVCLLMYHAHDIY